MKNRFLFAILAIMLPMASWSQVIIPWGHNTPCEMKYVFQENDEGVPPDNDANGKAWYDVGYDDSSWGTLTGPISRGDYWEVGEGNYYNWENEYGCFYLRRLFTVNLSEVDTNNIYLKSTNDDFADYYINGVHIPCTNGKAKLPADLLVDGTNTIAVYINDAGGDAYLDYIIANPANDISMLSPYQDEQGVWYEYNEENESWEVTGHDGWSADFVIPANLFDKPVTAIRDWVFGSSCNSISLPEGLLYIGNEAFAHGTLTSLTIPASVTEIGNAIVWGCENLTQLTVAEGNTVYDSRDNCNAIIRTEENKLIVSCAATTIPETVTALGWQAFKGNAATEFTIPAQITFIEDEAFIECDNLTKITVEFNTPIEIGNAFPNRITQILYVPQGCKEAFQNASPWNEFSAIFEEGEELVYPSIGYVKQTDTDNGITLTFFYDNLFNTCRQNGETVYPLSNGEPEWNQNRVCESVTRVVIDASFADARPQSTSCWFREMPITSIEGLEYLNTSEVTVMYGMFCNSPNITSLDLSTFDTGNVTDMSGMFEGCTGLVSLDLSTFDASRVEITDRMLADCSSLTELTLPFISNLSDNAFEGTGSEENPCQLNISDSYDFGDEIDTSAASFCWKGGWFHTGTPIVYNGPYVVFNEGTLSFYCDDQRAKREGTKYKLTERDGEPEWIDLRGNITHVVIDESFANARPTTTHSWFRENPITSIEGLEYLNTSEVTSMYAMFYGLGNLTSLDLSTFDASQVENTEYMFANIMVHT